MCSVPCGLIRTSRKGLDVIANHHAVLLLEERLSSRDTEQMRSLDAIHARRMMTRCGGAHDARADMRFVDVHV